MCGIIGAIAQRQVAPILIEGLKKLEYRGYDSAGMAVIDQSNIIQRKRALGKVSELESLLISSPLLGHMGIAHTRWATHGRPAEHNAHPHLSGDEIALVHNGIIENYAALRNKLMTLGFEFTSETDTEIVAHLIRYYLTEKQDFLVAVQAAASELEGAFALGVVSKSNPHSMIALRRGSPLVIGLGSNENFIASDQLALLSVAQEFIYLEEGDLALVSVDKVVIWDEQGNEAKRKPQKSSSRLEMVEKGAYRHFMQKEIFEQPQVILDTLEGRLTKQTVLAETFGSEASKIFEQAKAIQIIACGTSYHAGLVAKYWIEELAGISCNVEIASEFRYRKMVVQPDTLFVTISQSGETADTLAALHLAKKLNYLSTLAICNVPHSSLVRESDLVFITRAGTEIGVASTKAFTTQLTALLMLALVLAHRRGLAPEREQHLVQQLINIKKYCEQVLLLEPLIKKQAKKFIHKKHALFLGRGIHTPIAMEGALKLKEISYIHAEAYPAGELKHGPLALVDEKMPVIVVVPHDHLLEKLKSNIEEVRARNGELFIFIDENIEIPPGDDIHLIKIPAVDPIIAPIIYTIPLQLLSYHVAVLKGTDVDQPRNLAKSVTVE